MKADRLKAKCQRLTQMNWQRATRCFLHTRTPLHAEPFRMVFTDAGILAIFSQKSAVAVVGCGYAGLPVAVALSKAGVRVLGFDIDTVRVRALRSGIDSNGYATATELSGIRFFDDLSELSAASCFIIVVPTPYARHKDEASGLTKIKPDLRFLVAASEQVGRVLKPGNAVIFESTVFPGCTEEVCAPALERVSGLRRGADFRLCYAPERINPGPNAMALYYSTVKVGPLGHTTYYILLTTH